VVAALPVTALGPDADSAPVVKVKPFALGADTVELTGAGAIGGDRCAGQAKAATVAGRGGSAHLVDVGRGQLHRPARARCGRAAA